MREIKFRAWDKKKKRWHWADSNGKPIAIHPLGEMLMMNFPSLEDLVNLELMQYTGLKDKNGVEIYEGDITTDGDNDIFDVTFSTKYGGWVLCSCLLLTNDRVIDIEVIGNIYENPELIEVEE